MRCGMHLPGQASAAVMAATLQQPFHLALTSDGCTKPGGRIIWHSTLCRTSGIDSENLYALTLVPPDLKDH